MMTTAVCRPGIAVARMSLVVMSLSLSLSACQRKSEIVLVVDTDLMVTDEIDRVEISVTGSEQSAQPIAVDLAASGTPSFPLTLGLVSAGTSSNVLVTVVGKSAGVPVVTQTARTAFVEGEQRMLRMLLLVSCVPVTCPADQSCGADGCGAIDRPARSLPAWAGQPPARPVRNTPIAGRTVWASGWHSAAIEGQTLYAWGQNADGQLGSGTTQNANSRRQVMNVRAPASVGLGQLHSCICDGAKQAWCWGRNAEGQLGTGDLTPSLVPKQVPALADCQQIAGGAHHTCALRADRTVWCWGQNTSGQVGQPAGTAAVTTPQMVPGLSDIAEVGCGELFSCARKGDGTILCWGRNDVGQLGDGTTTTRSDPAPVPDLTPDIAELVTGRFFACVRHTSGQITCWGSNSNRQLGIATPAFSTVPVAITGIADASQLTAGHLHACFIHGATALVSCWGGNPSGQLGDGTSIASPTPVDVLDIVGVTSVAAGSQHTCARHSKGVSCWGDNLVNQLGDGGTTNRSRPVTVSGF